MRMPAFALFALLFFVTRVVVVPLAVLKPAMLDSRWEHRASPGF